MTTTQKTWDVWVGGDVERFASPRAALALYTERVRQYGPAIVQLTRDGEPAANTARQVLRIAELDGLTEAQAISYVCDCEVAS